MHVGRVKLPLYRYSINHFFSYRSIVDSNRKPAVFGLLMKGLGLVQMRPTEDYRMFTEVKQLKGHIAEMHDEV